MVDGGGELKGWFRHDRDEETAMEEAALPRTRRDAALAELEREDLDLYSIDDLQARILRLEAEIGRARRAIETKQGVRSAAESLFSFGKA
jgi:uncharacterized small protein (DUF1192 family)